MEGAPLRAKVQRSGSERDVSFGANLKPEAVEPEQTGQDIGCLSTEASDSDGKTLNPKP